MGTNGHPEGHCVGCGVTLLIDTDLGVKEVLNCPDPRVAGAFKFYCCEECSGPIEHFFEFLEKGGYFISRLEG